jgi:diacylglycerol O-acyltransferase / wax synthase
MHCAPKCFDSPDELSALDTFIHRGRAGLHTRMDTVGVAILDTTPDWGCYLRAFEQASRRVLRLRQKVVVPSLPITAARWVIDPYFDLAFHVRRVSVPKPGTLREVLDFAEIAVQSPLDVTRPLWNVTLVEGLDGGRAAHLLHISHAITDGVGAVEMLSYVYDPERHPPPSELAPLPFPHELSATAATLAGIGRMPRAIGSGARRLMSSGITIVRRAVAHPIGSANRARGYARVAAQMRTPPAQQSPLLRDRSLASRTEAIDIDLAAIRAAARAGGGSINDVYLAGLCGALRRYHDAFGVAIDALPMTVAVNVRKKNDPLGGNRLSGMRLAAPVGIADPAARIHEIQVQLCRQRNEGATDVFGALVPFLNLAPTGVVESLVSMTNWDVQTTNVQFFQRDTYVAGAKILRQYALAPLTGMAVTAVLLSLSDVCSVTVRYDRASVSDETLFAQCLRAGFDEVLEIGGASASCCLR